MFFSGTIRMFGHTVMQFGFAVSRTEVVEEQDEDGDSESEDRDINFPMTVTSDHTPSFGFVRAPIEFDKPQPDPFD